MFNMRILFFITSISILAACTTKKENTETIANESQTFVLDSLLKYNSEAELIIKFGRENIARDTAWYPEGMGQYMISVLYPGTNNEVEFSWKDSVTFNGLQEIALHKDSSEWSTHGVKVGTTLEELIRLNKKDFTFSGFGWDYGGAVFWNEGGDLADLMITLDISNYDMPQNEQDSLLGDQSVSSKSPIARKSNPVVREILLVPAENRLNTIE